MERQTNEIVELFEQICRTAQQLSDNDPQWSFKQSPPLTPKKIRDFEYETGIVLPREYKVCLQYAGEFWMTHYYLRFYDLDMIIRLKEYADIKKENTIGFGCIDIKSLQFDHRTGQLYMNYTNVHDSKLEPLNFREVLSETLEYLQNKLKRLLDGKRLLQNQLDNEFRDLYDRLCALNTYDQTYFYHAPPVTEEEICEWEKKHSIHLPDDYREWLKLTNGSSGGSTELYSLDAITEWFEYSYDEDVRKLIVFGSIIGDGTDLVFDSENGDIIVADHGGEEFYEDDLCSIIEEMITFLDEQKYIDKLDKNT